MSTTTSITVELEQPAVPDFYCYCQSAPVHATEDFLTFDVVLSRSDCISPSSFMLALSAATWSQIKAASSQLNGNLAFHVGADGQKESSLLNHPIRLLAEAGEQMRQTPLSRSAATTAIKFLLPAKTGHFARSDIIDFRLESLRLGTGKAVSFSRPSSLVHRATSTVASQEQLIALLEQAVGAVVQYAESAKDAETQLHSVQQDIVSRLSLSCILPSASQPVKRQRLALVHLGPRSRMRVLRTTKAMGISLVILDVSDSWVQEPEFRDYYADFVAMDMAAGDDGLTTSRIVEAVNSLSTPVDGVVSLTDRYLRSTADAAQVLGLPTEPSSAYELAVNKHKMRELNLNGTQMLYISSLDELEPTIESSRGSLKYPLVVKPAQGAQSRGVRKVDSESELRTAVTLAMDPSSHGVLIEAFVDGPEIDANFVLLNGEILFFEMVDEIPIASSETNETPSYADGFAENQMLVPSVFLQEDADYIKETLHKQVLQMGFSSGVMHVEARVGRTKSRSHTIDHNGVLHSQSVSSGNEQDDSSGGGNIFIIEVNPRPPGSIMNDITCLTWGVDYIALQMLFALQKFETIRSLSQGFVGETRCWSNAVVISTSKTGTLRSGDIRDDLAQRLPDHMPYVTRYYPVVKQGQQIKTFPAYVALILVTSNISRAHSIEIGQDFKKEARVEIDGDA